MSKTKIAIIVSILVVILTVILVVVHHKSKNTGDAGATGDAGTSATDSNAQDTTSGDTAPAPMDPAASKYAPKDGMDCWGGDIAGAAIDFTTVEDCAAQCDKTEGCVGFTVDRNDNKCKPKGSNTTCGKSSSATYYGRAS